MLRCLRIRNLAIIDELELELGPGLNVLTGETGAGKSILVGALELLLGGRGRADLVRTGARDGEVEGLFELGESVELRRRVEALSLGAEPNTGGELRGANELVVRRVVSSGGRTRAFINGKLVTQQMLCELARGLADISSQHEHHTLTDPSTHLGYLDAFAGALPLCRRMAEAYQALAQAQAALSELEARLLRRGEREEQLRLQIDELEQLAPEPGEELELERECARLRGMDALLRLTGEAAELLYEQDDSLIDGLSRAGRLIAEAAELDVALQPLSQQLDGMQRQLEDVARALGHHAGGLRVDPEALSRAEERLHQLSKLKRRHGRDVEGLIALLEQSRAELDELGQHGALSESLAGMRARAFEEARTAALALSAERRRAARRLSSAISRELAALGMGGAQVSVELVPVEGGAGELAVDGSRLSARGLERAEFLIAPNRGEEPRPLHRVASGGELSRAMLAIKCVLAGRARRGDAGEAEQVSHGVSPESARLAAAAWAGLYVFDEVDSGVGGGMAEIIGRKIREVAQHRQVLCITHLPQIAAFADQHFKVEKAVKGERTASRVRRLSAREQGEEIARMLGGVKITAKTRAVARELLKEARQTAA